jgi:prevent-host-death family protein
LAGTARPLLNDSHVPDTRWAKRIPQSCSAGQSSAHTDFNRSPASFLGDQKKPGLTDVSSHRRYSPPETSTAGLPRRRLTTIVMTMVTISKGVLKARLLEFLRQVEATGEELVITNHGTPVLKIVPIAARESADVLFADVSGKLTWTESPDTPTVAEWKDV